MRIAVFLAAAFLTTSGIVIADDQTRSIQEELRRRNLYFGDIDGRMNPELCAALKRYQNRKELEVTGDLNEETASSLGVAIPVSEKPPAGRWPDVPILRSDEARHLSQK